MPGMIDIAAQRIATETVIVTVETAIAIRGAMDREIRAAIDRAANNRATNNLAANNRNAIKAQRAARRLGRTRRLAKIRRPAKTRRLAQSRGHARTPAGITKASDRRASVAREGDEAGAGAVAVDAMSANRLRTAPTNRPQPAIAMPVQRRHPLRHLHRRRGLPRRKA